MYKWNKPSPEGSSDRDVLKNSYGMKPYIVEAAVSRVLIEIMDWIEKSEIQKNPVEASTRSPKKGK